MGGLFSNVGTSIAAIHAASMGKSLVWLIVPSTSPRVSQGKLAAGSGQNINAILTQK